MKQIAIILVLLLGACANKEVFRPGAYSQDDRAGNNVSLYLHAAGTYDLVASGPAFPGTGGRASGIWQQAGQTLILSVKEANCPAMNASRILQLEGPPDSPELVTPGQPPFLRFADDQDPFQPASR